MKGKSKYIIVGLVTFVIAMTIAILHYREKNVELPPLPVYIYKITHYDTAQKKYILMAPCVRNRSWRGRLAVMNMATGEIIFQKYISGAVSCLRQLKIDGKTCYTYLINDLKDTHIKEMKLGEGTIVLTDSSLNEIKRFYFIPNDSIQSATKLGFDPHDFILLSGAHYIGATAYSKLVKNIPDSLHPSPYIKVLVPAIQEVKDGKLTWQWDASKFPELYGTSMEHNRFSDSSEVADYLHINSMVIDPNDSNLVCSFRNSNQVIKINRSTGDIAWKLGGNNSDFPITNRQVFLKQHDAHFTDNNSTLILFDNGDSVLRQASRILEFKLDEKKKEIIAFKEYTIPEPYSQFMGSVDKLGDTYFIGGGSANYILEINAKTGYKNFELFSNLSTFRAYLADDIPGIKKQEGK